MGKDASGKGQQAYDYYGSIAGVVCAGPIDEIVGLVVDNKMVWPGGADWAEGVDEVPSFNVRRVSNVAYVRFQNPTKCGTGNVVTITGFSDTSLNYVGAVTNGIDAYEFGYPSTGANIALVSNTEGLLTKTVTVTSGDVQRFRGRAYTALSTHTSLPSKRPPNAIFWKPYTVLRSAQANANNPYPFTVEGYSNGSAPSYIYWGTAAQNLDASGEALLAAAGHPNYRRQCVVVLKNFLFGRERVTAPNIELVVRRKPNQSVISGTPALLDSDGQTNPAAIAAEWLTDPVFGLGLDILDTTTGQAVAAELMNSNLLTYISPILDRAQPARALFSDLASYFDGWFRWTNTQIEVGRFIHDEAPPTFDASNTIDKHDLTEEGGWQVSTWSETSNEVMVRFKDREHAFKDGGAKSTSTFNRKITGEAKLASVDKPWIKRRQQAADYAAEWLKIASEVFASGTVQVRAEKATAILPGGVFRLTNDAAGVSIDCRCTEKTLLAPPSGRVDIKFVSERSSGRRQTQSSPIVDTGSGNGVPMPESILRYVVVQVPAILAGTEAFQLAVLASRTNPLTTGFNTWFKQSDSTDFYNFGATRNFAVYGTLANNYNSFAGYGDPEWDDNGESLWLTLDAQTVQADLDNISLEQTEDAVTAGNLLIWVFRVANSDNEIMTVRAIRAEAGVYKFKVRRRVFGSTNHGYVTGDRAFIFYRSTIKILRNELWDNYPVATMPDVVFRFQAFNALGEADLDDPTVCPNITTTITWTETPGPVVRSFTANIGNGSATSFDIVHGLNSSKVGIDVTEVGGVGGRVDVAMEKVDVNTTRIKFPAAPSANQYRVKVSV